MADLYKRNYSSSIFSYYQQLIWYTAQLVQNCHKNS